VDLLQDVIKPLRSEQERAIHTMLEGLVCRHEGDSIKAKNLLERSLRVFSSEPGFYTVTCRLELALALQHMGKDDVAVKQLKQTVKESRDLNLIDIEQKAMARLKVLDKIEWGRLLHAASPTSNDGFIQAERTILANVFIEIRELEKHFGETPEAHQQIVNDILHILDPSLLGTEAILGQTRGGLIQVIFGLEDSVEPVHALEFIERFHQLVRELKPKLFDETKLGMGAGLVVTEVLKGTFGTSDRREFDLYGQGVEKARFLASAASNESILLDESTYRNVSGDDSDKGVKTEVVWRGLPLDAYRIVLKRKEVFRGSLGDALTGG
jgi:hypothetical protein